MKRRRARDPVTEESCPKEKKAKGKAYCHFKSKWRSQIFSMDIAGSTREISGEVLSGEEGGDTATCLLCNSRFLVKYGGSQPRSSKGYDFQRKLLFFG